MILKRILIFIIVRPTGDTSSRDDDFGEAVVFYSDEECSSLFQIGLSNTPSRSTSRPGQAHEPVLQLVARHRCT